MSTTKSDVSVAVCCNNGDVSALAHSVVNTLKGFQITSVDDISERCINSTATLKPEICILEFSADSVSLSRVRKLRARSPSTHVLAVASINSNDTLFAALRAGAAGFVALSELSPAYLARAIVNLKNYGAFLPRETSSHVLAAFRGDPTSSYTERPLTGRERELLDLLSRGHRPKIVARMLNLSCQTVRTHVRNIYKKLGVSSISHAVTKVRLRRRSTPAEAHDRATTT